MTPLLDSKRQPTSSGSLSTVVPFAVESLATTRLHTTQHSNSTQRSEVASRGPIHLSNKPTTRPASCRGGGGKGRGASSRASGKIYDPRNHLLVLGAQTHIVTQLRGNNSNDVENCVKRVHYFLPLLLGRWRSPREELWPCPTCSKKKDEEKKEQINCST